MAPQNGPATINRIPTRQTKFVFPCGISVEQCVVTPEEAEAWLGKNVPNNRNKKWRNIGKMVSDMQAERFYVTHQGIAFDQHDALIDGQNRLQAVVEAGVPIEILVFRNVPREYMPTVDVGTIRHTYDNAKILGYDFDRNDVATARSMLSGCMVHAGNEFSDQEILDFCVRHNAAIDYSQGVRGTGKLIGSAPMRALVARAYYTADRDRLDSFIWCLKNSCVNNAQEDSGVTQLLKHAATNLAGARSQSTAGRAMFYRKAQRALKAFLEREPLGRLYETTEDLFPIDDPLIADRSES